MPGTTVIPANHTVNQELLSFRKSPSIMYGSFDTFSVSNDTTFAFIRYDCVIIIYDHHLLTTNMYILFLLLAGGI